MGNRPAESVADLVARLGPPPEIVVQDWRHQLIELLQRDAQTPRHRLADRLCVDAENRLDWIESRTLPAADGASEPTGDDDDPAPTPQAAVQRFLIQVGDAKPAELQHASTQQAAAPISAALHSAAPCSGRKRAAKCGSQSAAATRRRILGGSSVAVLAGLVWALNAARSPQSDPKVPGTSPTGETAAHSGSPRPQAFAHENAFAAEHAFAADADPSAALSTLEPTPTEVAREQPLATDSIGWEPPSLVGSPSVPVPSSRSSQPDASADKQPPNVAPMPLPAAALPENALPDAGLNDWAVPPQVSPPEVSPPEVVELVDGGRVRAGPAVTLPSPDAAQSAVTLVDHAIDRVAIQFPTDMQTLRVVSQGELPQAAVSPGEQRWAIVDDRAADQPQPMARIVSTAAGTQLVWTAAAADLPAARYLANARLQLDSAAGTRLVYLRPTIEIDPLPFRFQDLDQRIAWSLGSAVAPQGTQLQMELEVPSDVQFVWIETPGAQPQRRSRAVAQLRFAEHDFPAIRIRWDLQAGVRFSCRQRTAVRLDATTPWQLVSLPGLSQTAERVLANLTGQQQLLERLLTVYSDADYQQRKFLRPRRDQLQQQVDALQATAERLSQLIRLLELLEADGRIGFQLTTAWPDDTQAILSTAPPAAPGQD